MESVSHGNSNYAKSLLIQPFWRFLLVIQITQLLWMSKQAFIHVFVFLFFSISTWSHYKPVFNVVSFFCPLQILCISFEYELVLSYRDNIHQKSDTH